MNFPSQVFFNDISYGYRLAILKKDSLWLFPLYMVVATYLYYEKVRRTKRTAIVSNLLKTVFIIFLRKTLPLVTLLKDKQRRYRLKNQRSFSEFSLSCLPCLTFYWNLLWPWLVSAKVFWSSSKKTLNIKFQNNKKSRQM